MAIDNVVVVGFPDESKAYQALSIVTRLGDEGLIGLRGAAVVKREADGRLVIPEGTDRDAGGPTLVGGLIGALIGLLGGPVGVLLGWGTGSLIGLAVDAGDALDDESLLKRAGQTIAPGTTGLIAEVTESSTVAIDAEMSKLGGIVVRRPVGMVDAEIKAAEGW